MIRRFALLSAALHLSVAIALAYSGPSRLAAPSAELQATLVTSQTIVPARTASASRPSHRSTVDASPLVTDTASSARIATAPAGAVQAAAGSNNSQDAAAGNEAIVNHLLSELRAALDAGFIYPPIARRHGWQGQVQLGLTVDADGRLSDLCVLSSSGYSVLDKDAIRTVARIGALSRAAEVLAGRSIRLQLPVFYRLIEG